MIMKVISLLPLKEKISKTYQTHSSLVMAEITELASEEFIAKAIVLVIIT